MKPKHLSSLAFPPPHGWALSPLSWCLTQASRWLTHSYLFAQIFLMETGSPSAFAKCLMAKLLCKFLHLLFFVSLFVMGMQGVCYCPKERHAVKCGPLALPQLFGFWHSIPLHATLQELGSCISSCTQ